MLSDELLAYLFDEQPHLLRPAMTTWLVSSRRFATFATTFRDKIRKKLRTTQDQESLLDLRLELETAYLLLNERTLSVIYEPQPPRQERAPDFAVSFTTSITCMVEVTRLRASHKRPAETAEYQTDTVPSVEPALALPLVTDRLADTICSKLSQLLPQRSNVLVVGVDALSLTSSELHAAMLRLQQRVETNDPGVLQRHRFRDRADFFRQYQRLSELLVRGTMLHADAPVAVWANPQARHPLPGKLRTALYRSHTV